MPVCGSSGVKNWVNWVSSSSTSCVMSSSDSAFCSLSGIVDDFLSVCSVSFVYIGFSFPKCMLHRLISWRSMFPPMLLAIVVDNMTLLWNVTFPLVINCMTSLVVACIPPSALNPQTLTLRP